MSSSNCEKIEVVEKKLSGTSKSYCCQVELVFDDKGNVISSDKLEWFPKSLCSLEEVEYEMDVLGKNIKKKKWYLTAPTWMLEQKNIKYK